METSVQTKSESPARKKFEKRMTVAYAILRFLGNKWITIVGSVFFGMFATWMVHYVQNWIEKRPLHAIWDQIINEQGDIPVVFGGALVKEFYVKHPEGGAESATVKATLPNNVPLLGVQEAIGISFLRQNLTNEFGVRTLSLYEDSDFKSRKTNSSFISVGGASINDITFEMLVQQRLDKQLKMIYPDHYALDEADGQTYRAERQNELISKDYGFIVIGRNPYDVGKLVILAFGIWPQGTKAALDALAEPDTLSQMGRQFIEKIKAGGGVVAVVETKISDLQQGRPHFVKVRDLAIQ
jgi:hypothetical protein